MTHSLLIGPIGNRGQQQCCAQSANGTALCEDNIPIIDSTERGIKYCLSTNSTTGTVAEYSQCVVVSIHLSNNSLAGVFGPRLGIALRSSDATASRSAGASPRQLQELMAWERTFHDLQELHVDENDLFGRLPFWLLDLERLRSLRLQGNRFEYESPIYGRSSIDELYLRCDSGKIVSCVGIPTGSCSAFFPPAALRLNHRHACTICEHHPSIKIASFLAIPAWPWLIQYALFLVLLCLFCALIIRHNERARSLNKRPHHLRRWVAGASVLITHCQTLALVGDLRLALGDEVRVTSAFLSVDLTWLTAPECTQGGIGSGTDRQAFFFVQLLHGLTISTVLLGLVWLSARATKQRDATNEALQYPNAIHMAQNEAYNEELTWAETRLGDHLDLVRSTVHSVTFGISLRTCVQLLTVVQDELDWEALLKHNQYEVAQVNIMILKYFTACLLVQANLCSWQEDWRRAAERKLSIGERVDRMQWSSYIRQRFSPFQLKHFGGSWQQIIYMQQIAIAFCSLMVDIFGRATIPVVTHALAVLAILLVTWWLHNLTQPYEYSFMNLAASVLTLANLLLVSISLLHDVLLHSSSSSNSSSSSVEDPAQLLWLWVLQRMVLVPGLLTLLMAAYLTWGLITSAPPSLQMRDPTPSMRVRRHNDGSYVPIAVELSPLHGRAIDYLHLPSNAVAVENISNAQPEMSAVICGGMRFPDALAVYGVLRPQGDSIERALFQKTFDAFVTECSMIDQDEQLRLISRVRAAASSQVWRCRLIFCGDAIDCNNPDTTSAYDWHRRWKETEEWQHLLVCAQDRKATKRAALLTIPATAERPSTLEAIFWFSSSKNGAQLCREVVEGQWSPFQGPMRLLWTQLKEEWDVTCESGLTSWPRFGETGAGRENFMPLQLDRFDDLSRYMDALRSSPVPALVQKMHETCNDHQIGMHSRRSDMSATQQIRRWLSSFFEAGSELLASSWQIQSLVMTLEEEVHTAMLAAAANAHPSLNTHIQRAWPDEASASEPTDCPLERQMQRILQNVRKYCCGGYINELTRQPSFAQLGISVHLCRHMASSRDARTLEKWWITFVDRRVENPSRILVQNEWLGNDLRHIGRLDSGLVEVSPSDAAIQEMHMQVRRGAAVWYDSAFASAICLPRDRGGALTAAALMLARTTDEPLSTMRDGKVRFCHEEDAREVESSALSAEELTRLLQHLVQAKQRSTMAIPPHMIQDANNDRATPLSTPTPPPSPPEGQQSSSVELTDGVLAPSGDVRAFLAHESTTPPNEAMDHAVDMASASTQMMVTCHLCGAPVPHSSHEVHFCGECGGALTYQSRIVSRLYETLGDVEGQRSAATLSAAAELSSALVANITTSGAGNGENTRSPTEGELPCADVAGENMTCATEAEFPSADVATITVSIAENGENTASVPDSSTVHRPAISNPQQSEASAEPPFQAEALSPATLPTPIEAVVAILIDTPTSATAPASAQVPDTLATATPAPSPTVTLSAEVEAQTPAEPRLQVRTPPRADSPSPADFETLTEVAELLTLAEAPTAVNNQTERLWGESQHEREQRQLTQDCFMQLAGDAEGLPLSQLGVALQMLKRNIKGTRLQELVAKVQRTSHSSLTCEEFCALLDIDVELRRQTLFVRLMATCPSGVLEVLHIPPLWEPAADGLSAVRQEWYAQLCYAVAWRCLSVQNGELQLRDWTHLQAVAAEGSASWPTLSIDDIQMRVHVCANDMFSHRSEEGIPHRECCCWLVFENAARPLLVPGELHAKSDAASVR